MVATPRPPTPRTWGRRPGSTPGTCRGWPSSWVNHSQNAYGIELKASDESSTNQLSFKSGQDPNQGNRPTLDIEYEPWYGLQPFMTYEGRQLSDRMDLQVNVANGNAVIHNTDSAIQGTGLNQTIERR